MAGYSWLFFFFKTIIGDTLPLSIKTFHGDFECESSQNTDNPVVSCF